MLKKLQSFANSASGNWLHGGGVGLSETGAVAGKDPSDPQRCPCPNSPDSVTVLPYTAKGTCTCD